MTEDDQMSNDEAIMAKDLAQDCVIEFLLMEFMRGRSASELRLARDGMRDRARHRMQMHAAEIVSSDPMRIQTLAIEFLDALLDRVDRIIGGDR